jgi:hypothetical protein
MRTISRYLILLLVVSATRLDAGGSIYSRYGIGDLLSFHGTRSYAFGGASAGLIGDGFINLLNPAGMARIRHTRFASGFEFTQFQSKTDIGSAKYGLGSFQGAAFAIPVDTAEGIVVSLEATPFSSVRYAISRIDTSSSAASHQSYYGSGGISILAIGSSVSLTNNLQAGAKVIYYFGRTRQYVVLDFDNASYTDGQFDRIRYYSGLGYSVGLLGESIGDLIGIPDLQKFTMGISFQGPVGLEIREEEYLSVLDTTNKAKGTLELPYTLTVGGSYLLGGRYLFAADYSTQAWGSSKVFGTVPNEFRNASFLAGGVEILPEQGGGNFLTRTAYRLGLYHSSSYIQLQGNAITETGFTAGLGIPIAQDTRLDLGLQIGLRGTMSSSLQKDTILRFSVGFSASEVWFMQFADE